MKTAAPWYNLAKLYGSFRSGQDGRSVRVLRATARSEGAAWLLLMRAATVLGMQIQERAK